MHGFSFGAKLGLMQPLEPADARHLRAADGWLGPGSWREANEELDNITAEIRAHPAVLRVRWQVYAAAKHWPLAIEVAQGLTKMLPDDPGAWGNPGNSLYWAGRTQEARDALAPALPRFPGDAGIRYSMACYECQLGRLAEAKELLEQAFALDDKLRLAALDDPDLEPLWKNIGAT